MVKQVIGNCALCKSQNVMLEESHIIPKFVYRYQFKNAFGKVRRLDNPKIPAQDSEKHYLLCGDCEDRFNVAETLFAAKIFRPYLNNQSKDFEYEEWLSYFIVSVNWRCLYLDITDFVEGGHIKIEDLEILINSERIMKDYLLNKRDDICYIENHLFFFDDIKNCSDDISDLNSHHSIRGSQGGYTIYNEFSRTFGTISNLLGILIISLYSKGKDESWENTLIDLNLGRIAAKDQGMHSIFSNELIEMLQKINSSKSKLKKEVQSTIVEEIKKNPEEFKKSRTYREMAKDHKLRQHDYR